MLAFSHLHKSSDVIARGTVYENPLEFYQIDNTMNIAACSWVAIYHFTRCKNEKINKNGNVPWYFCVAQVLALFN